MILDPFRNITLNENRSQHGSRIVILGSNPPTQLNKQRSKINFIAHTRIHGNKVTHNQKRNILQVYFFICLWLYVLKLVQETFSQQWKLLILHPFLQIHVFLLIYRNMQLIYHTCSALLRTETFHSTTKAKCLDVYNTINYSHLDWQTIRLSRRYEMIPPSCPRLRYQNPFNYEM